MRSFPQSWLDDHRRKVIQEAARTGEQIAIHGDATGRRLYTLWIPREPLGDDSEVG